MTKKKYIPYILPILVILMIFVKNHDLYIAAGGFMGFAIGYFVEKDMQYDVRNKPLNQVLKVILGVLIALVVLKKDSVYIPRSIISFSKILLLIEDGPHLVHHIYLNMS